MWDTYLSLKGHKQKQATTTARKKRKQNTRTNTTNIQKTPLQKHTKQKVKLATTKLLSEQNQLNRIAKHQINFPLALTLSGERKHMLQSAKTTKQQARITQQEKRSENNRIVLLPKDAKKQKQHRKNAQDKGNEPTTRKHPQNINAQAQNTPVAQKNVDEAILTRPNT